MKTADLHLHTCFSDGTYTPAQLVKEAAGRDLAAIAVTDHDTVAGVKPALEAARPLGLEVIPAIELTAEHNGKEIHILGYFIDYEDKVLLEKLAFLKANRIERARKIVSKLRDSGIVLDSEDVFNLSGESTVGRLHIARAMVQKKLVGSTQEAFQRYIGDKSPAYVTGFHCSPEEAIGLINRTGGLAVLAHPYTLNDDQLLLELVRWGIRGIEVYYPEHHQSLINFYLRFARQHGLLVTGGSDCHGSAKPEVRIGSLKIPYELVEKLKEAKNAPGIG